jgi:hypothetical protein
MLELSLNKSQEIAKVFDGRTKVTWRQLFMKSAAFEQAKSYLIEANKQNFDRLNDLFTELND